MGENGLQAVDPWETFDTFVTSKYMMYYTGAIEEPPSLDLVPLREGGTNTWIG